MGRNSGGNEPRPNVFGFRYSNTVKEILQDYKTSSCSWNDAFEKLVLTSHESIPRVKNEEKEIEKIIERKKKEIEKLNKKINSMENVCDKLQFLGNRADSLKKDIDEVTKDLIKMKDGGDNS
jgi:peptidoglycan hydrolase CwlO-like protein